MHWPAQHVAIGMLSDILRITRVYGCAQMWQASLIQCLYALRMAAIDTRLPAAAQTLAAPHEAMEQFLQIGDVCGVAVAFRKVVKRC